ncbi:hypothetical protein FPV67DRAFT_311326 [Lyophyllum atratum]|nr:hypothetical protein FPV67DRAFT_311326 [Lyophyllum atratum]
MSSPSTPAPASPLQPYHIRNLILILRRANAHYTYVASRIRATLQPTRHARRRAQRLGLTIDVGAAVKCPQKQVSNIPLPVLEVSPGHALSYPYATASPLSPPIVSIRKQPKVVDERLLGKGRPALKCSIPTVLTRTSPNGTTSALSSGSVYSSISLSSGPPAKKDASAIRYSSRWFATEDQDYPHNATEVGASPVRAAPALQQVESEAQWQLLDVPIDEDEMDWDLELQYPEDVCDMDVSPATSASSESSSSSSASESNSDSIASSPSPATPSSGDVALPLMIRIKRKSMEVRDEDLVEKRPRVYHNDDEVARPLRRNVIRIPARQ